VDTSTAGYDGLDEARVYRYSPQWQVIEEDADDDAPYFDSATDIERRGQHFWGIRYIDDAVAKRIDRDGNATVDWTHDDRDNYYFLTDVMFSVRGIVRHSNRMQSWIDYSAYGEALPVRYAEDFNADGSVNSVESAAFMAAYTANHPAGDFDGSAMEQESTRRGIRRMETISEKADLRIRSWPLDCTITSSSSENRMHPVRLAGLCASLVLGLSLSVVAAQDGSVSTASTDQDAEPMSAATFEGLELRSIGPALMSGRVADLAVHPDDQSTWYVAVGSGNLWKTTNAGTTWHAIFDDQGSYSIGCVTIDPNNPETSGSARARTSAGAMSATATGSTAAATAARPGRTSGWASPSTSA
jgi:hypothetical protein